jgi:uncharacterized protein
MKLKSQSEASQVGLKIMLAVLATSILALLPAIAEAQAFNCRYAKSPDEVLVCQEPELGKLDEEVSSLYYSLRGNANGFKKQRIDQINSGWLRQRGSCGRNYACVRSTYNSWIADLSRFE